MVSSGGRCERQATVHRSCFRRLPCLHWQPRSTEALSKLGKSDTILPARALYAMQLIFRHVRGEWGHLHHLLMAPRLRVHSLHLLPTTPTVCGQAGHNFTDLFYWHQRATMHGVAGLPAWFAPRGLLGRLAFDVRPIGGGRLGGVLRIPPQLLSHLRHFALQPHNAAFVPVNDHPQCRLRRCWNLRPQLWRQGRRAMHRATALISTATALQVWGVKDYY